MREIKFEDLSVGDKLITADGRDARVICLDFNDANCPLIVAITSRICDSDAGFEFISHHTKDGDSGIEPSLRKLSMPPKKEYLVIFRNKPSTVIPDGVDVFGYSFDTREEAEAIISDAANYIKIIEVEV